MPDINPETDEVVEQVSRTTAMRVAESERVRATHRATADVISTLEDKHWWRGWMTGFVTGVPVGIVAYKVYLLFAVWIERRS